MLRVLYFAIGVVLALVVAYVLILRGVGGDYLEQSTISGISREKIEI